MRVKPLLFAMVVVAALGLTAARADGEAGLVIDWGDGSTSQYCVAFEGNSIAGDQLLARAGLNVNQFSGLVCGINGTGCQHSGTFNSCTCECQDLGGDCTYWAFFSKGYGGGWSYSASGFRGQPAGDGDMHAWRWGQGSPSSAPAPASVSFEQVCGHPPASIASPTSPPPTATPTRRPPTATATATSTAAADPTPSPAEDTATPETPSATPSTSPSASATTAAPDTAVPASTQPPGTSPTIEPPAAGDPADDNGGGNAATIIAFGAAAGGMALLAVAGWVWRARHGG